MSDAEKKFRRLAKLTAQEVDGEIFIVDDICGKIHSLGKAGSAVWRLLGKPQTRSDCLAVFGEAFPNETSERLETLVDGVIAGLENKGLIY